MNKMGFTISQGFCFSKAALLVIFQPWSHLNQNVHHTAMKFSYTGWTNSRVIRQPTVTNSICLRNLSLCPRFPEHFCIKKKRKCDLLAKICIFILLSCHEVWIDRLCLPDLWGSFWTLFTRITGSRWEPQY